MDSTSDFCVVGGGIAGLTLARALALGGARVAVVDRGPIGRGAAHVAAGMLAPLVEARLQEQALLEFSQEALRQYPGFVAELQEQTGVDVDYRTTGTLIVAVDRDDAQALRHRYEEHVRLGLPVQWLNGYECRSLEPCLAPGIPGGILSSHDHQLDNRLLLGALRAWCVGHPNVDLYEDVAGDATISGGMFQADALTIQAGHTVIATGARADLRVEGCPGLARLLHPVKGQILRLDQSLFPLVRHIVRTPDVYLVPKSSGMLVVGATTEERGFNEAITAGAVYDLLKAAWECLPGIYELPLIETSVGFRPATRDHLPILGAAGPANVSLALGYYRHGVLLAPIAARILANWLLRGERSAWLDQFSIDRFHTIESTP